MDGRHRHGAALGRPSQSAVRRSESRRDGEMNMELVFPEDAREARGRSDRNVSEFERWASIAAGAGLAAYGLSRLKSNGWLYAGVGALLLWRGATAHCDLYEAFGVNTAGTASDTRAALRGSRGINVLESVTINRPIELLY